MLKKGSFINRKYYSLLAASLLGAIANGINFVVDSMLSGNQLGETALTAVAIVAPLSTILYFFPNLFFSGYGIIYGEYNGKFDTENSYRVAGQSIIVSIIMGVVMAGIMLLVKQSFLNYYGCVGELYTNASDYYNWIIVKALLLPLANSLYFLLIADADTLLVSVGGILSIVSNIVFSSLLCRKFGVSGLGMGTAICIVVVIGVYMLHCLRKTNSIHFKFTLCFKEITRAVKLSCAFGLAYLFVGVTDIIMNKVILIYCGVAMVTAYSIVNLVYSIYEVFAAPYSAVGGFVSTFSGERNNEGIRNSIKTMLKCTVIMGLVVAALIAIFAPQLPKLYGMESPEVIYASTKAARFMAIAAVPYGIGYVMESVYPLFNKVRLSILMTSLLDLLGPLAVAIPLTLAMGFDGVYVGMGINSFIVLGVFALIIVKKYGKRDFPLYLTEHGEETVSFDLEVNNESIVRIRDLVAGELAGRGYEIENIELLIEELYRRIYEKNPGKKVMSECVLFFGEDYVRIIVRDDGVVFDFVDENNKIESVNAHVLNSLLEKVLDKEYILTTSFNRNGFIFEKEA